MYLQVGDSARQRSVLQSFVPAGLGFGLSRATWPSGEEGAVVGVLPALLAAFGFAAFQVVNRRALTGVDVYRATAVLLAISAVILAVVGVSTQDLGLLTAAPWWALLYCAAAGLVHFFLGWTFLGMSQVRLGAARAGLMVGTVPLFGALLAAIFLGETLGPISIAGLILVVGGVAIVLRARRRATPAGGGDALGALAGLATAGCWAVSPILIRRGLEGLPSPVLGAMVGMATSAAVYTLLVVLTGRSQQRAEVLRSTRGLLVIGGLLVGSSIWMQWVAFDLARVATVLALLQFTPATVVALSVFVTREERDANLGALFLGTGVMAAGAVVLVLRGAG